MKQDKKELRSSLANEMRRDNPYVDRKRRREGKENEICWSTDATSGRGQKDYPFSHLEKGDQPLKSS